MVSTIGITGCGGSIRPILFLQMTMTTPDFWNNQKNVTEEKSVENFVLRRKTGAASDCPDDIIA
jgi:hypothetical protein